MRQVDNSPKFHGAQCSGPNDIPNPVPPDIDLFEAVLAKRMREFDSMAHIRAQGLKTGECRNTAFERLQQGRARRHVLVRFWEDPHLKGRVLIEKPPVYATTSVRSEKGRRRAATEKRHASILAKSHKIKDVDVRLAYRRAGAMWDLRQLCRKCTS